MFLDFPIEPPLVFTRRVKSRVAPCLAGSPGSLQVVATPRQIQELLDTPLSDCRETRRAGPGEWVMDQ